MKPFSWNALPSIINEKCGDKREVSEWVGGGSGSGDLEGNATTSPLVRASDHIVGKSLIFISLPDPPLWWLFIIFGKIKLHWSATKGFLLPDTFPHVLTSPHKRSQNRNRLYILMCLQFMIKAGSIQVLMKTEPKHKKTKDSTSKDFPTMLCCFFWLRPPAPRWLILSKPK